MTLEMMIKVELNYIIKMRKNASEILKMFDFLNLTLKL